MPSKEYEDMLAQARESADDDVDVEPVGRRPSVPMEAPVEPVKAAAPVAKPKPPVTKVAEVKAAPVKVAAPAKLAESTRKPIIETEGPGADRRRAIGEGFKSAAKSVGDYFSSLKSPSRMRDEARQKSKTTNMKSGGSVSSASSRGDGIAQRGKTRGKVC